MSIQHLGELFKVINPFGGLNYRGDCMHCAVATANALITGNNPPHTVDGSIAAIGGRGPGVTQRFPTGMGMRENAVLTWLRNTAVAGGVYAVDAEDHAYNFVKGMGGEVYLVDSNQHVFKRINSVADFCAAGHNAGVGERYNYNYANPEPGDDGSDIEVYYWGQLANRWVEVLRRTDNRIGYTGSGAATWG